MRLIIRIGDLENAHLATRAALSLIRDGYKACAYGYGPEDKTFFARRNKSSVTVTDQEYYDKEKAD